MCGLVGVAGQIFIAEKKAFRDLLWFDTVRGKHSTGVASVKQNNTINTYKAVGSPHSLYDAFPNKFDKKDDTINEFQLKALIGHNRFATMGEHTPENAHPFTHGRITGAHNGTLSRLWLDKLDNVDDFEVDSEAIFFNINKNGLRETVSRLNGAWALTFYDDENQRMNFIRNSERPLMFTWSKDRKTFFWASEKWMLEQALGRAKIAHEGIYGFKSDQHYYLNLGDKGELEKETLTYDGEPMPGFTPPVVTNYYGNFNRGSMKNIGYEAPNVVIPKSGVSGWTPAPGKLAVQNKMKNQVRKEIEIILDGPAESVNGTKYMAASPVEMGHDYEVRLYAHGTKKWNDLMKAFHAGNYYKVVIKKYMYRFCKGTNECYLLGDLRSLSNPIPWNVFWNVDKKDVDEKSFLEGIKDQIKPNANGLLDADGFDKHKIYKGPNESELSYDEFMDMIKAGCLWCNHHITPSEVDEILPVSESECLCPDCSTDKDVREYITDYIPNFNRNLSTGS